MPFESINIVKEFVFRLRDPRKTCFILCVGTRKPALKSSLVARRHVFYGFSEATLDFHVGAVLQEEQHVLVAPLSGRQVQRRAAWQRAMSAVGGHESRYRCKGGESAGGACA